MAGISDSDKLGLASMIASGEQPKKKVPLPRPRPDNLVPKKKYIRKRVTAQDVEKGIVSPGDANDEMMLGFKSGGMIDRAAIRGKTRGKMC